MFREHGRFVRLWFGGPPHKGFTADPATMVVRVHEMATPKALPRPLIGPYPSKAAWISFFGEHQARYNACGIVSHDMAGKPAVRTMGYIAAITRTLQTISGSIISSARILYENEAPVTTVIIVASIKNIPAINNISSWLHLYASGEVVKIPELYREGVGVIFEEMRRLHESRPRVAVYFYRRLFEGSLCRRLNMHLTTLLEEDGELDSILLNIEK
jgi:hypothetical protein